MTLFRSLALSVLALAVAAVPSFAADKPHIRMSVGGGGCFCYLPTMLAKQIGAYEQAGLDVEIIDFKGGSQSLIAVLGGSADIVSGYYDHTIELQAKGKELTSFVVYDRYPGMVLAVAPKNADTIKTVKDLAGKKVGVSAPGSSTDFFLKYVLVKNGLKPDAASVVGVGLGATAVAAMEQVQVDAAVMLDPAVTQLQARNNGKLPLLSDSRSQKDTLAVFGGDYPGGAVYAPAAWIKAHPKETQGVVNAVLATLKWIHSHSPDEIAAKMPKEMVGDDVKAYAAALGNTLSMYSLDGKMDPKGAQAVLEAFRIADPEVRAAKIDLDKTYTNRFADAAK